MAFEIENRLLTSALEKENVYVEWAPNNSAVILALGKPNLGWYITLLPDEARKIAEALTNGI